MLLLISLKTKAEIKDNKFCYDRPEAEKIFQCLEMKKVYEDLQIKRTESLPITPSETAFFDSAIGRVCLFIAGFGLGFTISEIKH